MKNQIYILALGLLLLACKKDETPNTSSSSGTTSTNSITYPNFLYYGENVLAMPDSSLLDTTKTYSFGGVLGADATLKLKITRLAPRVPGIIPPIWSYEANPAWWLVETDPSGGGDSIQTFTAIAKGKIDLKFYFSRHWQNGKARIEFYENSDTVTRTKYLRW
jgi:hypothetical protein